MDVLKWRTKNQKVENQKTKTETEPKARTRSVFVWGQCSFGSVNIKF